MFLLNNNINVLSQLVMDMQSIEITVVRTQNMQICHSLT